MVRIFTVFMNFCIKNRPRIWCSEPVFMCFAQFYALFFSKAAKENAANAIILTITIAAPDGSSNA